VCISWQGWTLRPWPQSCLATAEDTRAWCCHCGKHWANATHQTFNLVRCLSLHMAITSLPRGCNPFLPFWRFSIVRLAMLPVIVPAQPLSGVTGSAAPSFHWACALSLVFQCLLQLSLLNVLGMLNTGARTILGHATRLTVVLPWEIH
jgi:hypothetical protein